MGGGVFWNFRLGLRENSWKFGFLGSGGGGYSGTSDLDLGKKVGNLDFWDGRWGYSGTSDLDLGKKVGNLDFWDGGGVFWNFGFGLRKKIRNLDIGGGYSGTSDLDLGKKVGNLDFWDGGGVFWKGDGKKKPTLQKI